MAELSTGMSFARIRVLASDQGDRRAKLEEIITIATAMLKQYGTAPRKERGGQDRMERGGQDRAEG